MFWWKFAKCFMSFSKLQVNFSSNFAWLFSVLKNNPSVLFQVKRYILHTKETNQRLLSAWMKINQSIVMFEIRTTIKKYMRFEVKKYRQVIFHDTEQWCKIWTNPEKFTELLLDHLKSENFTFMRSFCEKHIMFQQENFRGIVCHDAEMWCKI